MILVTGATGFIGQHLVDELFKRDYEIGILVNRTNIPERWANTRQITIFSGDISNFKSLLAIPKNIKFHAAFHLAAHIPKSEDYHSLRRCLAINCIGTNNILQFCRNREVKKIIYSSTVLVYRKDKFENFIASEDSPIGPQTSYGISKLAGELLCERFSKKSNLKTVILRYSFVYGLWQNPRTVLPIFIDRATNSEDLIVYGSGARFQDFVYVKDVISGSINALISDAEGIFNIGSGVATDMRTLAETVIRVTKSRSKIVFDTSRFEGESGVILDISRAKRELGYRVDCDIESGLADYHSQLTSK